MAIDRRRIYHKRDRLKQLRAFCHAARLTSIARAAEHLVLSHSAVSLHVRELEHEMQAVLFERRGPRVTLTPAGERLYRIAMPLVEAMDDLSDLSGTRFDGTLCGAVRLVAEHSAASFFLPPVVERFRDAFPGVRLHMRSGTAREGLALLSAGEVDLVVGARERESEEFVFHPVHSFEFVLITPADHPLADRESVALEEAGRYSAIVPSAGAYGRQLGESIAGRFGAGGGLTVEAAGWDVIKSWVEAGLGVSVVPSLCLTERDRVRNVALRDGAARRTSGVFARRDGVPPPPALRFIRMMVPDFPEPS